MISYEHSGLETQFTVAATNQNIVSRSANCESSDDPCDMADRPTCEQIYSLHSHSVQIK